MRCGVAAATSATMRVGAGPGHLGEVEEPQDVPVGDGAGDVDGLGDGYLVEAYALAQHYLPGEGLGTTSTRHALMGNTWTFHVRVTPEGPRVARFTMDCRWMEGDPTVLLAAIS
jgi:hypothetical protein